MDSEGQERHPKRREDRVEKARLHQPFKFSPHCPLFSITSVVSPVFMLPKLLIGTIVRTPTSFDECMPQNHLDIGNNESLLW
jgi:hypothetical protein